MDNIRQEQGGDLIISGSGSVSGGQFNLVKISGSGTVTGDVKCHEVKISGSGKVTGDVDCGEMRVSGSCRLNGNIKAEMIKISGSSTIRGNLNVESFEISGSSDIDGEVEAESLIVSGSAKAMKNLSGNNLEIKGSAKIKENCEASTFKAKGVFDIGGLLSADDIDISLYGKSKVREMGGEQINVRKLEKIFPLSKLFVSFMSPSLTVQMIEGDDIYLECTKARVVRGNHVNIGPDCEIELVEYKEDFYQGDGAKVKESKKI